ncbi:hypothetical protein Mapa_008498 [Marchantia paleacea]|nr:hypothetical protein Mapa_008498 [Marchantia paleacea]
MRSRFGTCSGTWRCSRKSCGSFVALTGHSRIADYPLIPGNKAILSNNTFGLKIIVNYIISEDCHHAKKRAAFCFGYLEPEQTHHTRWQVEFTSQRRLTKLMRSNLSPSDKAPAAGGRVPNLKIEALYNFQIRRWGLNVCTCRS